MRQLVKVEDYVKSKDNFGESIALKYDGEDTFKTCPGGCLSLIAFLIVLVYAVTKGHTMVTKGDWVLT